MAKKTTNPKGLENSEKFIKAEIITILGAKIIILTLIWAFFFKGNTVEVSNETIAPHFAIETNQ